MGKALAEVDIAIVCNADAKEELRLPARSARTRPSTAPTRRGA
jgi:hypothetical protein